MWFFNKKKKTLEDMANCNRIDPHGQAAWATIDSLQWNGAEETGVHFGFAQNNIMIFHEPASWFKKNRSIAVGGEIGPVMYSAPNRHTLVCAPTRAGKTAGILIPTLLTYQHSVLAIDPKGELSAVTAARRKAIGQKVIVLNPWNLHTQALSPFGPHSFNPLDLIDVNDPNAVSNAMLLSSLLIVPGSDPDDFWNQSAAGLITGLILYVAANEAPITRTLSTLRHLLTQGEAALNQLFADMAASTLFHGSIAETGRCFLDMEARPRSSVLATARTQTDFLRDPVIRNALEKSTFSLAALKETPSTVYLVIPPDQLTVHGRWLRLMVGAAIKVFQSEPRPKHRCLFILEEFPALGPMSAIETGVATLAGYGVDFLFAIQNLGQLEKLYKQGAATFLANSAFKYFTAINDLDTAKYVSSILGTQTITVNSDSLNAEGDQTVSSHLSSRPLKLPEELMAIGSGQGFLIRPSGNPIRIKPRLYHQDAALSQLVAANPFHQRP